MSSIADRIKLWKDKVSAGSVSLGFLLDRRVVNLMISLGVTRHRSISRSLVIRNRHRGGDGWLCAWINGASYQPASQPSSQAVSESHPEPDKTRTSPQCDYL